MPNNYPALGALSFGIRNMKSASKKVITVPVTVTFTAAQLTRLRNAAVIVGCTAEELIVAGSMHGLDCSGDGLNDAKAGLLWSVESYARERKTFVHASGFGENSAMHPLQTTANNGDPVTA